MEDNMDQNAEKKLIVNADDLGFSKEINNGIFKAHTDGIVTSASLAVNMPFSYQAIQQAQKFPDLGVGIHLNVVRGKPFTNSKSVAKLIAKDGTFKYRTLSLWPVQLFGFKSVMEQIEREFRAQIEAAVSWGLKPTHLDSERHHAAWPILFRLMADLAKEYKIPALRLTEEPFWGGAPKRNFKKLIATAALREISKRDRKIVEEKEIKVPKYFYGSCHIGKITEDYVLRLADALTPGTSELMVHPGFKPVHADADTHSYLDPFREDELNALTSTGLREKLTEKGIKLVDFSGI
jgi:predicted glycoside hydrolase/deacetylase ChbG (UPF0249 family)